MRPVSVYLRPLWRALTAIAFLFASLAIIRENANTSWLAVASLLLAPAPFFAAATPSLPPFSFASKPHMYGRICSTLENTPRSIFTDISTRVPAATSLTVTVVGIGRALSDCRCSTSKVPPSTSSASTSIFSATRIPRICACASRVDRFGMVTALL